jgi:AraC family transcriptional regulator, transcriptional activator of pobA
MKYNYSNTSNNGLIAMVFDQAYIERNNYEHPIASTSYIIAWNRGKTTAIKIDEVLYNFPSNAVLPLMHEQCFEIDSAEQIVLWEFNTDFYCIVNHDAEVGCVGYIFYGPQPNMFINLNEEDVESMNRMFLVFEEEFTSVEDIKQEMLRMLLVRLIIKLTRLAKKQYITVPIIEEDKFNLIRKYHLLVELHYKKEHQVNFYANLLHKSPKTISNYFTMFSKKTPLQVIHERIIAEAKRLTYYTEKSIKEIAHELGFEDVAHFSKFFKNVTAKSPSEFRNNQSI